MVAVANFVFHTVIFAAQLWMLRYLWREAKAQKSSQTGSQSEVLFVCDDFSAAVSRLDFTDRDLLVLRIPEKNINREHWQRLRDIIKPGLYEVSQRRGYSQPPKVLVLFGDMTFSKGDEQFMFDLGWVRR